tara:strand:+ start:648 stop:1202 length:555 start_codon:yes stop_codon:yes gene_type:complete
MILKTIFPSSLLILLFAMLTVFLIDNENQIEELKHKLEQTTDSLNTTIDSLKHVIDTLQWENQIWDFNLSQNTTHLLSAIMFVESSNNDSAYHKGEDAVGCLQIRKCMVDDVNRILKRKKIKQRFYYEDRWNRHQSIKMFNIYCKHYRLITAEEIARCWNGGPGGMKNEMTVSYWKRVSNKLNI